MKLKTLTGALVALSLGASPVFAAPSAQPGAANPAASLSVASGTRVAAKAKRSSKLSGGVGILAALIFAGIVAIPVIDAVKDDNPASP